MHFVNRPFHSRVIRATRCYKIPPLQGTFFSGFASFLSPSINFKSSVFIISHKHNPYNISTDLNGYFRQFKADYESNVYVNVFHFSCALMLWPPIYNFFPEFLKMKLTEMIAPERVREMMSSYILKLISVGISNNFWWR